MVSLMESLLRTVGLVAGRNNMSTFMTKVHEGFIHNRDKGTTRNARWIEARDIPLALLVEYGVPARKVDHPHNVKGRAWDLDSGDWRIVRNASSHNTMMRAVQKIDGKFQL